MLLSTLPELPGRIVAVLGVVCTQGVMSATGGSNIQKMMQELAGQAEALEADGVVDIRTAIAGQAPLCILTGTAVKLE
jgi:uncharacterized protein YbjQ (UPF0145 family)